MRPRDLREGFSFFLDVSKSDHPKRPDGNDEKDSPHLSSPKSGNIELVS